MTGRPAFSWAGDELRSAIVREKIEWADHHRQLLHAALDDFRKRRPYFIAEDLRSHEGTEYRVLAARPEAAPKEVGLIFADYLENIRASLDFLVGAMRPLGPSRNSAFPILRERPKGPKGFKQRACVNLTGIPGDAVKLIHWMQPYHRPDVTERYPFKALAAVETLWNMSKHRTLLVVTSATRPDYVGRDRSDDEAARIGFRMSAAGNSSEIWLPVSKPPERFDPHFSIHMSLAKPGGFAEDWPDWVGRWELDGLVDHFYRVIRYAIAPQFNRFIQDRR